MLRNLFLVRAVMWETGQVEPRVEAPVEGNVSKTVMWDPVRDV